MPSSLLFVPESKQNGIDPEFEVILSKGYAGEEHFITTADGYILGLQRILPKFEVRPKKVALLQHGLLDSAHTWINNLANQSLGFIMADLGYDVWLGNSRGSTYSREHKVLDPSKREYWSFTYDEMAKYDLPAMINYIKSVTSVEKIFYIGHSQGCQIAFARFNEDPELQNSIHAFGALAPVAYVGNIKGPISFIAKFGQSLQSVMEWFGNGMFLPSNALMRLLDILFCHQSELPAICRNIIFLIAGFDTVNTNKVS
ncbi:unnamed protein product [Protopolystoma xenopodis]|uniref:Partial AB-hydrolase lipase domain-containing protein n=1 Tax=Protopolystoma xenopodis TaxID=117903 RepID=A0A3S5B835_9PLAT|nr:unnamed protein product [Protopolystoma xenopodis]